MAKLEWDLGARPYYAGVDRGVLYLPGLNGLVWNGLVSVDEKIDNGASNPIYFDGRLSGITYESEDYKATVSAYTYPDEFLNFTGFADIKNKQLRKYFSFSYHTGDDLTGEIHLVYNAKAVPAGISWQSSAATSDLELFSWDISTKPVSIPGVRPTSHLVVDLSVTPATTVSSLKNALYGTSTTAPKMPTLNELYQIFQISSGFTVTDNGDGTWVAEGSNSAIQPIDTYINRITWTTVVQVDINTYRISTDI